jgi:hypothetical protein
MKIIKSEVENDLRNLKGFSSSKVYGYISHLWFSCLRSRYPLEYLLYSKDSNDQAYYKNQSKANVIDSFNRKITLIVNDRLTQESVDALNGMLVKLKELSKANG